MYLTLFVSFVELVALKNCQISQFYHLYRFILNIGDPKITQVHYAKFVCEQEKRWIFCQTHFAVHRTTISRGKKDNAIDIFTVVIRVKVSVLCQWKFQEIQLEDTLSHGLSHMITTDSISGLLLVLKTIYFALRFSAIKPHHISRLVTSFLLWSC